jgi:hypothetical protein
MSHRLTVAGSVLLAIGLLAATSPVVFRTTTEAPLADVANGANDTWIVVVNETDNQQPAKVVDWVLDRYALVGLKIPDAEITFYPFDPTLERCGGFAGLYRTADGRHRIRLCGVGERNRRRILLHELAHAWTHENLSESEREALVADRGLDSWNDSAVDWEERGAEHAAEIMAWGLDLWCDPRELLSHDDLDSLAAALLQLTGAAPICRPRH